MIPNIKYIREITDGDKLAEKKILTVIKEEFPLEKKFFLSDFQNEQYREASQIVHKLKHKIHIFGLKKEYNIAAQFELDLKDKQINLYSDFIDTLNSIENFLKKV